MSRAAHEQTACNLGVKSSIFRFYFPAAGFSHAPQALLGPRIDCLRLPSLQFRQISQVAETERSAQAILSGFGARTAFAVC